MSIPQNQNQSQSHPPNLGGTHHRPRRTGPAASPARGVSGVRAGGSIGLAVTVMTTTMTTTTTITTGPASLARGTSRGTRRSRDVSGSPRLTLTLSDDTRTRNRLVTTRPRLTLLHRRTTTIPLSRVAAVAGTPHHRLTGGKRRPSRTGLHGIGLG